MPLPRTPVNKPRILPLRAASDTASGYDGFIALLGKRKRTRAMSTEENNKGWPGYRATLERVLPGAFAQAVADAETWFEREASGQLGWRFGEAEARRISQPTLSVLGSESDALWSRFGETHRLLLAWLPHAEGFVLPGATHFMQIENPRGMAEALAAFWARHRLATGVA
jgi:pimeloyl-ACP methyl ester carboxylesterase